MKDFDLTAEVRDCDYKCVKCGRSRLYSALENATINRDDCEKVLVENYVSEDTCRCGSNLFDLTLYIKLANKPDENKLLMCQIACILNTFPEIKYDSSILKDKQRVNELMARIKKLKEGERMEYVIYDKSNNKYLGRNETKKILRGGTYKTAEFLIEQINNNLKRQNLNIINFGIEEYCPTQNYDIFYISEER